MKTNFFKASVLVLFTIISISCSKDDSSSSTEIINPPSANTSNTWVKLTATTSGNVVKPNYIIMMFDQPVTTTSALPPIKKQVTTDANGLAYFDLKTMVTSSTPTTYYFEAFVETATGYTMKSVTHPTYNIAKGQMITSSIIVN